MCGRKRDEFVVLGKRNMANTTPYHVDMPPLHSTYYDTATTSINKPVRRKGTKTDLIQYNPSSFEMLLDDINKYQTKPVRVVEEKQ